MNKIRAFDYYSLRQRELMDFLRAVGEWGKHDPQFMAICSVVVYALIDKYNKMEEIFIRHRFNMLTPEVEAADTWRDRLYGLLRDTIKAMLDNPDIDKADTAKLLLKVINDFGYPSTMSYSAQTTALRGLCRDLEENHPDEVSTLALTELVAQLKAANEEFDAKFTDRFESVAGFEKGEMAAARKEGEDAYKDFVEFTNAQVTIGNGAPLQPTINNINARIDYMRTLLGQGANTPEAEPGEGTPPTGTPPADTPPTDTPPTDTPPTETPDNTPTDTPPTDTPDNTPTDTPPTDTPTDQPTEGGNTGGSNTGNGTGNENTGGTPPEEDDPNMPPPGSGGSGFE